MAKRGTKSTIYWRNRQIRQEATAFKSQQEVVETSVKAYNAALSDIDKSINKIFGNFTKTAELSAEDGKQLISEAMQNDIVQDLLKLKSQLTDKRQIKAVDNRINALAYGYRINRAEAVKQSIYVAMKNAGIKEAAAGERCIASAFENGYNGVMQGIGVSFDVLPQRAIDKAIKERWHGKNYSENVWANTSKVADKASGIIQSGLTSGKSIQDMSQELKDMIGDDSEGALYNATRLIRTETGHYMNQGELEAYKDSDLEYYEYLASDPCDECGELDGRRFKVSEAVEGVNYPVMHPNCRCTTIPVVDLDEVLEEMKKGG